MSQFDILTIKDVAQRLRLAERTVYAMVQDREIPAFKIRNQWRIRRDAFEAWLVAVSGGDEDTKTVAARLGALPADAPAEAARETPPQETTLVSSRPQSSVLSALTERVSQAEMHRRFVMALGDLVISAGPMEAKPLELDLKAPLPPRVRVYLFNATRPPGGRPTGEHKIQLIVPGQKRGERASFDDSGNRMVILTGYVAEEDVFVLWDAGLYGDFAWSRNVQVKPDTIVKALAGNLARQTRQLRRASGETAIEEVIATNADRLVEALELRRQITHQRLLQED